jgi:hypothetical protein
MIDETICPVCGKYHFEESGIYDECPICGWVDDTLQRLEPDYSDGYNRISANEAKARFASGEKVFDD